jgi:hypothetical protein
MFGEVSVYPEKGCETEYELLGHMDVSELHRRYLGLRSPLTSIEYARKYMLSTEYIFLESFPLMK